MCFGDPGPSGESSNPSALSPLAPTALPGEGDNPGAVTANQTPVSEPSMLETLDEGEISDRDVANIRQDVSETQRFNARLRGEHLSDETNEAIEDTLSSTQKLGQADETAGARQLETAEMSGANYFTRELAVGQSHPPSTMSGKGSLDYTMQRYNLPGDVASSIAFNPWSDYSTKGEKGLATAQMILPGGALVGGIRTLGMTGGRSTGGTSDNNNGGDNSTPVLPKKVTPRPVAKASQKKSAAQVAALSRFPEGSTVPFPQFRGKSSSIVSPRFRGEIDEEDGFGVSRSRIGGIA